MRPLQGCADRGTFARGWIDTGNRHELDAVLAHFTAGFGFPLPSIRRFAEEPSGRLVGGDAVRACRQTALSRVPCLQYGFLDVLAGVDRLAMRYPRHHGLPAEAFPFDGDRQAARGRALHRA